MPWYIPRWYIPGCAHAMILDTLIVDILVHPPCQDTWYMPWLVVYMVCPPRWYGTCHGYIPRWYIPGCAHAMIHAMIASSVPCCTPSRWYMVHAMLVVYMLVVYMLPVHSTCHGTSHDVHMPDTGYRVCVHTRICHGTHHPGHPRIQG